MKKKISECKLIRSLLENYRDDLTDPELSQYVEEHLSTCAKCRQLYGELCDLEKQEKLRNKRLFKSLRKYRRKVLIYPIIFSSLIIGIIMLFIMYLQHRNLYIKVANYEIAQIDYILEDNNYSKNGNIYGTVIIIFDDKDRCVCARVIQDGYKEEYLQERLNQFNLSKVKSISNYSINGGKQYYNMNYWNGWTKEEVIKYCSERYKEFKIKEL